LPPFNGFRRIQDKLLPVGKAIAQMRF